MEDRESVKPSFPEFVVALFLAKSKPPEIPVRDYLAYIRAFIRTGHRPTKDLNGAHYVDTLAFWKDSHQRLQQEMNEQRARIYSLERELDAWKDAGSQKSPQQIGKRPALNEVLPNGRRKKRKRTDTAVETTEAESHQVTTSMLTRAVLLDGSIAGLNCETHPNWTDRKVSHAPEMDLLDAIYALQKSLSQSPTVPSQTASIIVFFISQLRDRAMSVGPLPHHSNDNNKSIQPSRSAKITVKAQINSSSEKLLNVRTERFLFSILLAAIDKLDQLSDTGGLQDQLVYVVVKLLKDLLNQVCLLAAANVNKTQQQGNELVRRRSTRGKKSAAPQFWELTPDEDTMRRCSFLANALQALQEGRQTDQAIKEGFMFFLLRRIGETLNAFVFGEDDQEWEATVSQGDRLNRVFAEDDRSRQEKRVVKEHQAPYLIWLLEHSMACFSNGSEPASQNRVASQAATNSPRRVRQGILSEKVKFQLQHTILKEVLGDNFQDFSKAFDELHDPGMDIEPWTAVRQADVVNLFKAEVWRLIGWDCLKSHIDWENKWSFYNGSARG
ncbi:MAG: hypothetical protein Q9225_006841 [Loekoesia sp. 1 TL-2023]